MARILGARNALDTQPTQPSEALSELFHENTKVRPVPGTLEMLPGNYSIAEQRAMARGHKLYRLYPQIVLPPIETLPPTDILFDDLLARRRTLRSFADDAIGLAVLSRLLHATYGVTGEARIAGGEVQQLRAAPSAGGLYPGEIYLAIRNVEGVAPGIYHYEVPSHSLALLKEGDQTDRLHEICCFQPYARQAAVTVLIAGAIRRTRTKYGERGYRYVLLDIGHLAQNLCLVGVALDLAVTTTGGFFDDMANDLLRLDGVDEAVLYVAFVGKNVRRTA